MKQNDGKSRLAYSFTFQIVVYFIFSLLIITGRFYLPIRLPDLNHPVAQSQILTPMLLFGLLVLVVSIVMFIIRWRRYPK